MFYLTVMLFIIRYGVSVVSPGVARLKSQCVDSLRRLTEGYPLCFCQKDTLFFLWATNKRVSRVWWWYSAWLSFIREMECTGKTVKVSGVRRRVWPSTRAPLGAQTLSTTASPTRRSSPTNTGSLVELNKLLEKSKRHLIFMDPKHNNPLISDNTK